MKFTAEDGTLFETEKECRAYERAHQGDAALSRLVGLTRDSLKAALAYEDKDLGKAIEAAGRKCAAARIAAGDVSPRGRKALSEEQTAADATADQPDQPSETEAAAAPLEIGRRKKAA